MSKINDNIISRTCIDIYHVWRREFSNVFHNMGVVIFFLLLPTAYPIVYALIYNPELVREVPVVIVDDARTIESREIGRQLDATQNMRIIGYCANLQEAKQLMNERECYGILYLPSDFSRKLGRGEPTTLSFYSDMSLLIRYRGFLVALTSVTMEMGAKLQQHSIDAISPSLAVNGSNPAPSFGIPMGNTTQGFASFLLPGILVLILQQSLVLGITMLGASVRERRKKNGGIDPLAISTGIIPNMIGKALCYFTIYIIPTIYILHYVPMFFSFPQIGNVAEIFTFVTPYLFASIFLGMVLQVFVRERESSFLIIVFTSVIFLFFSGLTWPRYAMSDLWYMVSSCVPSTWAMEGFVRMNSNGATLEESALPFQMLWLLSAIYFVIAFFIYRFIDPNDRSIAPDRKYNGY